MTHASAHHRVEHLSPAAIELDGRPCIGCRTALPPFAMYCVECGLCQLGTTESGTVIARSPYAPDTSDRIELIDTDIEAVTGPQRDLVQVSGELIWDEEPEDEPVTGASHHPMLAAFVEAEVTRAAAERSGVIAVPEATMRYDAEELRRLVAGPAPQAGAIATDDEPPVDPRSLEECLAAVPEAPAAFGPAWRVPAPEPRVVAGGTLRAVVMNLPIADDEPSVSRQPVATPPRRPANSVPYFVAPRAGMREGERPLPPELRWRAPHDAFASDGVPRGRWGDVADLTFRRETTAVGFAPAAPPASWGDAPQQGGTVVTRAPVC